MESKRIKLINCDKNILELVLQGNEILAKELNINVPDKWTEFGNFIFKYSLERILNNPSAGIWWAYLPVFIESNTLIGSCGYKGEPNEQGMVEIGYEVSEAYRNQGIATEITQLLVRNAFENPIIKMVQAHTLAAENASVKVLRNNDFIYVEELEDLEDGKIWKWIKEK